MLFILWFQLKIAAKCTEIQNGCYPIRQPSDLGSIHSGCHPILSSHLPSDATLVTDQRWPLRTGLTVVSKYKNLGMILDSELNFKANAEYISKVISKLGILGRARGFIRDSMLFIYISSWSCRFWIMEILFMMEDWLGKSSTSREHASSYMRPPYNGHEMGCLWHLLPKPTQEVQLVFILSRSYKTVQPEKS